MKNDPKQLLAAAINALLAANRDADAFLASGTEKQVSEALADEVTASLAVLAAYKRGEVSVDAVDAVNSAEDRVCLAAQLCERVPTTLSCESLLRVLSTPENFDTMYDTAERSLRGIAAVWPKLARRALSDYLARWEPDAFAEPLPFVLDLLGDVGTEAELPHVERHVADGRHAWFSGPDGDTPETIGAVAMGAADRIRGRHNAVAGGGDE